MDTCRDCDANRCHPTWSHAIAYGPCRHDDYHDDAASAIAAMRDDDLSTRLAVAGFGPPRSGVPTRGRRPAVAYVDMAYAHRLAGDDGW